MRSKELIFVFAFIVVVATAMGSYLVTKDSASSDPKTTETSETPAVASIPQLESDGREESATMVLLDAPPMQPADHIDRWIPEQRQDSCLMCHNNPDTGAPTPSDVHYYDNDPKGKIFRDNCLQCHGQQNDTKAAFNEN